MELIFLLFLHHLADVAFQPSWLIKNKKLHVYSVFEHVMIYSGVISIGLYLLGVFELWHFFYFLIGHFVVDLYKYQYARDEYWTIYPDQALHYLQIIALYLIL